MKWIKHTVLSVMAITLLYSHAYAVHFGDGYNFKAPTLAIYPFWYTAGTMTDRNGTPLTRQLKLDKYGAVIRPLYYTDHFVFDVMIPVGKLDVGMMRDSDSGLGDIIFGTGYFVPVSWASLLTGVWVKTPTGSFDKNALVNFGDGQTDVRFESYLNKIWGNGMSFDAAVKYWVRFKDNGVDPGNELYLEALAMYAVLDFVRIGPSLSYMVGEKDKQKISVGGETVFHFSPKFSLMVDVMQDVHSKNQVEGTMVTGRFCYVF